MNANFLNNNGVLILVEGFSVIASVAAVVVALFFSLRTQRQYTKSLEPQLSMRLEKYDLKLYLTVRNTGRTAARVRSHSQKYMIRKYMLM